MTDIIKEYPHKYVCPECGSVVFRTRRKYNTMDYLVQIDFLFVGGSVVKEIPQCICENCRRWVYAKYGGEGE